MLFNGISCYRHATSADASRRPLAGFISRCRTPVRYRGEVKLVARWWNGQHDRTARRDVWLTSDGVAWNVRARHGSATEVSYDLTREYEARAMVDRLIAAAPGRWKDITTLVRKPRDHAEPAAAPDQDEWP
jgi:hypothetical protein